MSNANVRRVGSVSNALRILGVLADARSGLGVTELSRALGLGKSTVHLLLVTMRAEEFVEQTPSGKYRLGLGAFCVGAAAVPGVPADGRLTPLLRELAEESGEAVSLAVAHRCDAVIIQRIESRSLLRAEIRVGTKMPLHSSASGKCLLADMPHDLVDSLYPAEELPNVTPSTVRTKTEIMRKLAEVRMNGYARNEGEYTEGVCGIAAVVRRHDNKATIALSIAGPVPRFDCDLWVEPLITVAKSMTAALSIG